MESLFIEGNTKKAIAKVKKLLLFYPNSSLLFNIQGLLSSGLKNFDSALENYDKAIEKNPNFVEPYFNKGNAMRDNGNLNSALQCYKKAIKIKPDYAEVYNNMGNVFTDLGDFSSAVKSYREAIKIKPEYADTHYNLAVSLNDIGETTAALKSYNNALKINPELINAIYNKGNIYKKIGNAQFALDCYKKVLKLNPNHQQAAHLLASLIGETTKSAPTVYVEKLFDGYAPQFEHSLVGELEYKVPKKLTKIILDNHLTGTLGSVLDLGCGTGLMGLEIKKFCNFLEGLDISNAMLEQARQKNVYNKLSHREILDFLSLETLNFDYFIFADVFTYVGDLSDLFKLIKTRNKFGGKLAFSTEDNEEVGFFLEKTGRYSHSYKYIESLCKKFNYRILYFESINLRKQNNSFLTGKLYLLDF